jgi:CIC family chloride channel protein
MLGRGSLAEWLHLRLTDSQRQFVLWVVAGLACGFAAVLYHESIVGLFSWVREMSNAAGPFWGAAILIGAPTLGGLASGLIGTKIEKSAAGGGITQVKARYFLSFGVFRFREAFWRFVASALAVGSGNAMGPEGPTIHISAALASVIGRQFGLAKRKIQAMVPIGAAAGLSAAFNTPMAAMFFVFEELIGEITSRSIFGILIAVVLSAIVERTIVGEHALFILGLPAFQTSWWMLLCLPIAILAAVIGTAFVKTLLALRLRAREKRYAKFPLWLRPALAGAIIGLTGVVVLHLTGHDGVFSIGYDDLSEVLSGRLVVLSVLLILLVGKLFSYIAASTAGTSGGIFAPVLFFGGMIGAVVGVTGQELGFAYGNHVVGALALIGMGCMFASVIRCPLTSFMIVFEMTHNYTIMLPLMVGNIVAYALSVRWHALSLYDSMLLQDGITLRKMPACQGDQDWHSLPVQAIMTFDAATALDDLSAKENLERIGRIARNHHAYPVLGEAGKLAGIATHAELEELVKNGDNRPLAEILAGRRCVTVTSETSISDAARILVLEDVLEAPVVTPSDKTRLLGIVTLHDIARQQNAIE